MPDIAIDKIRIDNRQRKETGDLTALKLSIERKGLLHPIVVEQVGQEYVLIAGYRRLSSYRELGRKTIPATLKSELEELDRKEIELEENVTRKELNYEEVAIAIREIDKLKRAKYGSALRGLFGRPGWTQRDTARELGVSESKVSQDIKLANMAEYYPELMKQATRQDAIKMMRKIEVGIEQLTPDESLKKVKEAFHQGDGHVAMTQCEINSIEIVILDLHEKSPEPYIQETTRILSLTGNAFVFFDIHHLTTISHVLSTSKVNFDITPYMWHIKGRDEFIPFMWFSKNIAKPPHSLNRHNSHSLDKDNCHLFSKPYALIYALVHNITKQEDIIFEPVSYGLGLTKYCQDQNRIGYSYCSNKSVYDQCMLNMERKK